MNRPAAPLEQILRNQAGIWRGLRSANPGQATIATGFSELDAILPGGGWPLGALVEIQTPCLAIGELRLLLPAMAELSQAGRHIVWAAPPHQPYAPGLVQAGIALTQTLVVACRQEDDIPWVLEKLLRNRRCGMALAWLQHLGDHQSRRLQLAAEQGRSVAILFPQYPSAHTHAALRIGLKPSEQGLLLSIVKARGDLRRKSLLLKI